MSQTITILSRPRCRIVSAEPDAPDFNWSAVVPLPDIKKPPHEMGETRVRAVAARKALHIHFECDVPDMNLLAPSPPLVGLDQAEHAFILVRPTNDATHAVKFRGDFRGMRDATALRFGAGEASLGNVRDSWQDSEPFKKPWDWFTDFGKGFWSFEFIIPWRSLGLPAAPSTLGLGYGRFVRCLKLGSGLMAGSWPDPALVSPAWSASVEHGEAIIGESAGAPDRLELEAPRFGVNRATLFLGSDWPTPVTILRVHTADGVNETSVPAGSDRVDFNYAVDRNASSHLEYFTTPQVRLEALAGNDVVYTAAFPMDRHRGVCVDEPYGEPGSNDDPASERERILDRVVRALPRLDRRNTRQGAPSDFSLIDDTSNTVVNLMADDPWQPLVAIIESRFDTTEDRLVAAMALVGQKSVTNLILEPMFFDNKGRESYHSPLHLMMGPLSIMRYGGGPAVSRAAVLAALLQGIIDPATGKPFTARIVSLHRDGGPRQVDLHFEASTNTAPFTFHPGLIGCVAVDYADGQTLLDPTALAFFPIDGDKLATVENIVSDDDLRQTGAGALADAFGKLDIEEMRRHRANHLMSKVVYPEACPDESLPQWPFDPAHRQANRSFHAVANGGGAVVEGLFESNRNAGARDGSVSVAWNDDALTLTVSVTRVSPAAFDERDRATERVHLLLDVDHQHAQFHRLTVHLDGRRKHTLEAHGFIQTVFKHLSTENGTILETFGDEHWTADVKEHDNGYDVTVRIDWPALRVFDPDDRPTVMGLNAIVDGRHPQYEQVLLCPQRFMLPTDPFNFADVYLAQPGDPQLTVEEVDFGIAHWGDNVARVRLVNRGDKPVEAVLRMRTHAGFNREVHDRDAVSVTLDHGEFTRAEVPYTIDPRHKMTPGNPQRIELTVRIGETERFRAQWPSTYCGVITAYQRYDLDPADCPKPQPGEADFAEKKMQYVAARVGRFDRLTTRDGAPSDFVLRAADGSAEFNLMDDGILEKMGDWATSRFDNDVDRILGLFALGYNRSVLRHMSYGHRLMSGAGPLSIMRGNHAGGGGNCGYHSRAFGGMLANTRLNGDLLVGHTVGVWGHVISAFAWRGSKVIIDNDVGHFILNKDGSDFATLEEFRADPDVVTTAGPNDLARYFTVNVLATSAQFTVKGYPWPGAFPPGGAKE